MFPSFQISTVRSNAYNETEPQAKSCIIRRLTGIWDGGKTEILLEPVEVSPSGVPDGKFCGPMPPSSVSLKDGNIRNIFHDPQASNIISAQDWSNETKQVKFFGEKRQSQDFY